MHTLKCFINFSKIFSCEIMLKNEHTFFMRKNHILDYRISAQLVATHAQNDTNSELELKDSANVGKVH